jgi:glucan phosphoethanolaminetransferase (alkaline phosphatase superfamily)
VAIFLSLALPYAAACMGRLGVAFRASCLLIFALGCLFATTLAATHFGVPVAATMAVVLDTNFGESSEFVQHFLGLKEWVFISLVLLPAVVFVLQVKKGLFWVPRPSFGLWLAVLLIAQGLAHGGLQAALTGNGASWRQRALRLLPVNWFAPLKPYVQLAESLRIRGEIANALSTPNPITEIRQENPASPRTCVIIIGESMASAHMSLYGYRRPTTPGLDDLAARGELLVFRNAISSQAQTGAALLDAFTWKPPGQEKARTILDFFNAAGFHTSWISNQPGLGVFDNIAALLTHRAKYHMWLRHSKSPKVSEEKGVEVFMNTRKWTYLPNERIRDNFDESLTPVLEGILRRPERDKLIFVHLMGCHAIYRARFPKSFEFFAGPSPTALRDQEQQQTINDYDNAMRYNDAVITRMIETVRRAGGDSFVLCFSDHGEEVHDWREMAAHSNEVPSPLQLEIPFLLWLSDGFRKSHASFAEFINTTTGRPYCNAQFCATLANLAGCAHPELPEAHSLFARDYRPPPRMAIQFDYDEYRKSWRPDTSNSRGIKLLPINPDVARLDDFRVSPN